MPLFLRGVPLILILFRMWKRLPAKQRRQIMLAAARQARRHGLRVAKTAARQAREYRRRRVL